jgi:stage II sporulation protein D
LKQANTESSASGRLILSIPRSSSSSGRNRNVPSPQAFEIDLHAWLFIRAGEDHYFVNRVLILGGEKVWYHLNRSGRIDFLEVEPSIKGATADRVSSVSRWQEKLSSDEVQRRLTRAKVSVGEIVDLVPISRGESNRVLELDIIGTNGTMRIRGSSIRSSLGLRDILFVVGRTIPTNSLTSKSGDYSLPTGFIFNGRGWGHGVGLCQTGAYGLAREGYSASEILKKYYSGISVQKMY